MHLHRPKCNPFSRYRIGVVTIATVLAAAPLCAQVPDVDSQYDQLSRLKAQCRGTKNHLSFADAQNIAFELARLSGLDQSLLQPVADLLATEQMDWQRGNKPGLDQTKLINALNLRLGLNSAAEYLQLRASDVNKIRVKVWLQMPDLSSGIDRGNARKGARVVGSTLSPFEAFLTGTLLNWQKLGNDEYLRTAAEEEQINMSGGSEPLSPGLHILPSNPRRDEFRQQMERALKGVSGADAVLSEIRAILKEARK